MMLFASGIPKRLFYEISNVNYNQYKGCLLPPPQVQQIIRASSRGFYITWRSNLVMLFCSLCLSHFMLRANELITCTVSNYSQCVLQHAYVHESKSAIGPRIMQHSFVLYTIDIQRGREFNGIQHRSHLW